MKNAIKDNIEGYYFDRATGRRGSESNQHYHTNYEIYYMKEGKCHYFIGERSYDVVAGDVVFIPAGVIHRTNYGPNPHSRLLINFSEDFIPESLRERAQELDSLFRNRELSRAVEELYLKIEKEYSTYADEYSRDALRCYTGEIFYLLLRNHGKREERKSTTGALVETTVKYIQDNYMHEIRLSAVAKMQNVSAEHLSRIFKKTTGFGFNEYVTLVRLQRAEYMLKNEPGVSVSEVAYACGFNDGNYFSYRFKEMYGISPTHARTAHKAEGAGE